MNIPHYAPLTKNDIKELPEWAEKFLAPVHERLKLLTDLVQAQIALKDNMLAEQRTLKMTSGEEVDVACRTLKSKPLGVLLLAWDSYAPATIAVRVLNEKTVRVKVTVTPAPAEAFDATILILGA